MKEFLRILPVAAVAFATSAPGAEAGKSDHGKSDAALAQVAINVADLGRSEKYYRDVLGFTRAWQYPPDSDAPIEIGLAAPGGGAGLVLARLSGEPLPEGRGGYGRIIVNTRNARKLAAKAEAAGSKPRFVTIPGDNPRRRSCFSATRMATRSSYTRHRRRSAPKPGQRVRRRRFAIGCAPPPPPSAPGPATPTSHGTTAATRCARSGRGFMGRPRGRALVESPRRSPRSARSSPARIHIARSGV